MGKYDNKKQQTSTNSGGSEIVQEPKKKGGMFGGLFGSKPKKPQEVVDSEVAVYEEEGGSGVGAGTGAGLNMGPMKKSPVNNNGAPIGKNGVPSRTVVNRNSVKNQQVTGQEQPPASRIMSSAAARENYDTSNMSCKVFLYCNSKYFASVQHTFNLHEGIACAGISDPKLLLSEYRKKPIFNAIIIFLLEQSEVNPLIDFLVGLNLASLDPALLKITIVRDQDVDVNAIKNNEQLKSVPRLSNYIRLVKNTEGMTDAIVSKVIGELVQGQPSHPAVKPTAKPTKAELFVNTTGTFSIDIQKLNKHLIEARSDDTQNKAIVGQVKQRLIASNDTDVARLLSEVSGDIPSLQLIKEIEDEVASQMDRLRYNPRAKSQIAELIKSKLLLSTLHAKEFQTIINQIMTNAQAGMQDRYQSLNAINPHDLEVMNEIGAKSDELINKRNELRAKVDADFNEYLAMAKVVVTSTKLEEMQLAELNSSLLSLNGTVGKNSDETTLNNLHSTLSVVRKLEEDVAARGEQTKQQLAKAYAFANNLLKDTKRLINIDDALIKTLQAQVESYERTRNVILTTDTRLKERAHIIYAFPDGGFASMFGLISDASDLYVNVQALDGSYVEPEMPAAKNRKIIGARDLFETDPDRLIQSGEALELRLMRNELEPQRIIAILDYMSGFYAQIHIVMKVVDADDTPYSEMVEELKKNIVKVIYWTAPVDSVMLLVNHQNTESFGYNNVVIRKIVFNKFVLAQHGDRIEMYRTAANLPTSTYEIRVPYLKDMAANIVPPKEHIAKLRQIKSSL